jgi:HSP20 family protein
MTNTIAKRQNGNAYRGNFGNVVDNLFQNSLRRFFDDNFWEAETQQPTGNIPVNIRETDQQYELDVIAPGCRKEDFKINVENNVLTISMNQVNEKKQQDAKTGWERNEYVQRAFSRSFSLDDTVDLDKINATYSDGILRLSLGKNEKAKKQSRNIDVK